MNKIMYVHTLYSTTKSKCNGAFKIILYYYVETGRVERAISHFIYRKLADKIVRTLIELVTHCVKWSNK